MDIKKTLSNRDALLNVNPDVLNYHGSFKTLNRRWSGAITAGMIDTGRMASDADRLFLPLVEDMRGTKSKYEKTQDRLLNGILSEMTKKVVFEITDTAKFAINILKRNLFERTADVGYLATDSEIVNYIKKISNKDAAPEAEAEFIRKRLAEYQYEYTVYNEIIILDTRGRVLGNLDPENKISFSNDPFLKKALAVDLHGMTDGDMFVETFCTTDLMPGKGDVLIYAQKIEDPETLEAIGILCLCFDFEDEMQRIFKDLCEGNDKIIVAVLDEAGKVISSNFPNILSKGYKIQISHEEDFLFMTIAGRTYMANIAATDGYQGFFGLPWYGLAMIDCQIAFRDQKLNGSLDMVAPENLENFSGELAQIKQESDDLLADMKIDSLNGEVQFRAFQGNNIMDRNLYERANDVCWWIHKAVYSLCPIHQTK